MINPLCCTLAGCASLAKSDPTAGVYGIFIKGGERLLEVAGYFGAQSLRPSELAGYHLLYIGHAAAIGPRLKMHLSGDRWTSTFRRSLLALEIGLGALSRANLGWRLRADLEQTLTEWLASNVIIAVEHCDDRWRRERELLMREASPLNIKLRESSPFARVLASQRAAAFPATIGCRARRSGEL